MRHLLSLNLKSTKWVSIQDVLIRAIEQFSNLKKYFLQILPEKKGFKGKSGVGSSERYIDNKTALTYKQLPSFKAAVLYITKDFTVPLQDKFPMITGLYSKIVTLHKDKVIVEKNYLQALKPIHKLQKLDLNKETIQKVLFSLIC